MPILRIERDNTTTELKLQKLVAHSSTSITHIYFLRALCNKSCTRVNRQDQCRENWAIARSLPSLLLFLVNMTLKRGQTNVLKKSFGTNKKMNQPWPSSEQRSATKRNHTQNVAGKSCSDLNSSKPMVSL